MLRTKLFTPPGQCVQLLLRIILPTVADESVASSKITFMCEQVQVVRPTTDLMQGAALQENI